MHLPEPPSNQSRRLGHWPVWVAAIFLALAGAGFLLSQRTPKGGKAGSGSKNRGAVTVPVAISSVTKGNIGVYINALGTVTPVYTVTVTSRVAGQLMAVHYREGQLVRKGQLLAEIDARPYQAVVTQAEGQLERDRAQLKNAFIDLERYKMIYAQKAIPEQTLATQQATVEQNQGTVRLDQGNLDAAKVNLEYTQITAPIAGRIGLRLIDPGNIVPANGITGIVSIAQLQPITVIFTMAEDYLSEVVGQLRLGRKLKVIALDRSNQKELAEGTVLTIDNSVDTSTGTVKVRASFTNRDGSLFPNEFVNARLLVKTLNGVNLVPTGAIQRNNDDAYVYVVGANSTVQSHKIAIATTDGTVAAVTGVAPGDRLVVDGFDRLQDGVKVAVRPDSTTGQDANNPRAGERNRESQDSVRDGQ